MNLLFLNGALRRGGSTEGTIDLALQHLRETSRNVSAEVVHLCECRISVCDSCYTCDRDGRCWMPDDVESIVRKMIAADGIVYVFPVHAFGVNSLMQIFLERAGVGYLRFRRPLENKAAGVIVTGRRYSHELAWAQVALNIMLNKMVLVGSGFPATIKNDGKQLLRKIEDEEGLDSVKEMLTRIVEFLQERTTTTTPLVANVG